MADLRTFHGPNAGFVLELYERFLENPESVEASWRAFFENTPPAFPDDAADGPLPAMGARLAAGVDIQHVLGGRELARTIRSRGHTAARLNPLGDVTEPDPALKPEAHGITESELHALPPQVVRGPAAADGVSNAADAIARLRDIYSGTVGYEFSHIPSAEERAWLREAVESRQFSAPLDGERERALLQRLSQVEGFEKYLHRAFFGQKRFSIEGTDMMVPIMDEIAACAADTGAGDMIIGMAHRGRLNVLAHVLEKPYEKIIVGFQGAVKSPAAEGTNSDVPSGDVKYHMGWRTTRRFGEREIALTLSPNPSHLEFVNPVVIGMTRAAQDSTDTAGPPAVDYRSAIAVLVHGDAAFPGQGVVAETLNMSGLPGYTIGGTIHLIANNQVGFTTSPEQGRSTRYSSDLAKGFEVPVVHVNADDAEACLGVARMAHAYREQFQKDFVVDLVGYRRWGHNEGDEPLFTQPRMYGAIREHPTARERLAARLVENGVITREDADAMLQATLDRMAEVQASLSGSSPPSPVQLPARPQHAAGEADTAVDAERLRELNEALLQRPEGFTPNPRLEKLLERRRGALGPGGGIDWGHAESLAFASLLSDGVPVRMTGQDVERGTFSHRHLVLHDAETGETFNVLANLPSARASIEVVNSPLSEMAIVGFEYGYSVYDPQALVLWEAQFGDFINGAQVLIDQYLSASYQKWGQTSGLVLLLPHGYEGQGPEHSSARLERFLQLAAENNMRVANCTTSAQYFHLLRRQAALLENDARPLVVMSPKSLLRHPLAASHIGQLSAGRFQPVLGDENAENRADAITRLLLCSGKVYVDLVASDAREETENVALGRVEELYPLPEEELKALVASFPALREIVWVQEEPRNMGAWSYMEPRLARLVPDGVELRYEGRPERASPAEGTAERHKMEQDRIVTAAWTGAAATAQKRKRA
ncbi:MAG: 2-oxoglutarate dehydrogenase E1 component [Gemmatimonadetes bacterium]|nr:2-oxoglutarate dehydrogenase E1 component [Gemmatimonadota bacterium]